MTSEVILDSCVVELCKNRKRRVQSQRKNYPRARGPEGTVRQLPEKREIRKEGNVHAYGKKNV